MKKRITKILCFALTLVLMLSSVSVAFAKEQVTPVILVHGVGGSAVYENVGKDNEAEIKTFGLGEATDILKNTDLLGELIKLLSTEKSADYMALLDKFNAMVVPAGEKFNADKNGNIKAGQGIKNY